MTKRQPTPEEWTALRFAWRVCAHVKSNTIVFTGADRTMAVGAGQMSRVDSVKVAVMKAAPGVAEGERRRVGCVLPVPRRARRDRGRGGHGGRAAGWIGQGCRGDCRRRRARPGDGFYGAPPFPPLEDLPPEGRKLPDCRCRPAGRSRRRLLRRARQLRHLGRERGVLRRDAARDARGERLPQPDVQLPAALQQAGPELLDRRRVSIRCSASRSPSSASPSPSAP